MKKIFVRTKDKNSSVTHSEVKPIITIHKLPVLTDYTRQIKLGIQNGALLEVSTEDEVQRIYDDCKTVNPYAKIAEVKTEDVIDPKKEKAISIEEIIEEGDYKVMLDKALELNLEGIKKNSSKDKLIKALEAYLEKE